MMRIRVWNENTLRAGQLAWDGDIVDTSDDSHTIELDSDIAEGLARANEAGRLTGGIPTRY